MPSLVAFVLVERAGPVDALAVARAHRDLGGDLAGLEPFVPEADPERPLSPGAARGVQLRFADRRGEVLAVPVPVPVPHGEADEAAAASLGRVGVDAPFPAHGGHVVVVLTDPSGELSRTQGLARLTRAAAAVIEATGALGVYWGAGGVTHEAWFFLEQARGLSGDDLALPLWSGVRRREAAGRIELVSLGLRQLGLPELLLTAPAGQRHEALAWFVDLQAGVVKDGQPLREGERVGRSDAERLTVRYETSPLRDDEEVWRVDLP